MNAALSNLLFHIFGHRVCCGCIPEWTTHVGQKWDTVDKAPLNLYNVIWRFQGSVRQRMN
jgi:hypothetical protein